MHRLLFVCPAPGTSPPVGSTRQRSEFYRPGHNGIHGELGEVQGLVQQLREGKSRTLLRTCLYRHGESVREDVPIVH